MSLFRSEVVNRYQLFLPTEGAYNCIAEIGELGNVQFLDMTPEINAFQRKFVNDVRRCDEMERKLRYLSAQVRKSNIKIVEEDYAFPAPDSKEAIVLDSNLTALEQQLVEMNANEETLKRNYTELVELLHVLRISSKFFEEGMRRGSVIPPPQPGATGADAPPAEVILAEAWAATAQSQAGVNGELGQQQQDIQLGFMTGVIKQEKAPVFERLLWRFSHGNIMVKFLPIVETQAAEAVAERKSVFIAFYQGERLRVKLQKICESFKVAIYPIPETAQKRQEMQYKILTSIEDLRVVLNQSNDYRQRLLTTLSSKIFGWLVRVRKMKAIYHNLNLFNLDITERTLIGEAWIPAVDLASVQTALNRGMSRSGSPVAAILHNIDTNETPPTYFRTNKFTSGFQNIVDAYGIATYREVNPAPYTIITFPFLFAVMFGDLGHGIIMFLFALILVLKEKKIEAARIRDEVSLPTALNKAFNRDEMSDLMVQLVVRRPLNPKTSPGGGDQGQDLILPPLQALLPGPTIFSTFYGGRYIILLMGLFAVYTGFIYNEVFSRSFNIFGSSWRVNLNMALVNKTEVMALDPNTTAFLGKPYPFGTDPIWQISENALISVNSYKMKMSVIVGIMQMMFGVCLSLVNHIHFRQPISVFTEFIPQILFLCSIFFYLCIMIFIKWTHFGARAWGHYPGPYCAPSLLIGLINMVMFASRKELTAESGHDTACALMTYYPGQGTIEKVLVIIAAICAPIMLCGKPIFLHMQNKRRRRTMYTVNHPTVSAEEGMALTEQVSPNSTLARDHNHDNAEAELVDVRRPSSSSSRSTEPVGDSNSTKKNNKPEKPQPKLHAAQHSGGGGHGHEEESFGDLFIHQAIHTIEFCLGCISHTASYLRLWALSLAHSELTIVLWDMVMRKAFILPGYAGCVLVYFIFAAFAGLTVAILITMEGLSAFLHALRLHWVEFNSKFYKGEGYAFVPFAFRTILEEARLGDEDSATKAS